MSREACAHISILTIPVGGQQKRGHRTSSNSAVHFFKKIRTGRFHERIVRLVRDHLLGGRVEHEVIR